MTNSRPRRSSPASPLRPANESGTIRFSIPGEGCDQNGGSHCNTGPYDYALFVWNIFGLDIAESLDTQGGVNQVA